MIGHDEAVDSLGDALSEDEARDRSNVGVASCPIWFLTIGA